MKRASLYLILAIVLPNPANSSLVFTYNPVPLVEDSDTFVTIQSRWPERIQVFQSDPGFAANVVVNGNTVNLDVSGGTSLVFFPDTFTHSIRLGRFRPGNYQLRLRYRDLPTFPGDSGFLNPGVIASSNFTVGRGVELVTQVPTFSTNAAIGLSLMLLGLGVFAVRRQA